MTKTDTNDGIRLDVCGGAFPYGQGYLNVDRVLLPQVDIVADVANALPFVDDSVTEIVSCGTLEHLSFDELKNTLDEFFRVLRPGATLTIGVPDLTALMNAYLIGDVDYKTLNQYLYGAQKDPLDYHKIALDFAHLCGFLAEAGFSGFEKAPYTFPFHIPKYMMQVICRKQEKPSAQPRKDIPEKGRQLKNDKNKMTFTGERLIPDDPELNDLFIKHQARYDFSSRFVKGATVLDAGCGCGYGTWSLALSEASFSVGIDTSPAAIDYCRKKYDRANIDFMVADCLDMPFPDHTFDRIVSFEVLEHIPEYETYLEECRRVLKKDGLYIVSTPNKKISGHRNNPFHFKEFYLDEFRVTLGKHFDVIDILGQHIVPAYTIENENDHHLYTFLASLMNYYDESFRYTETQLDALKETIQKAIDLIRDQSYDNMRQSQAAILENLKKMKNSLITQLDAIRENSHEQLVSLRDKTRSALNEIENDFPEESLWFFTDVFIPDRLRRHVPECIKKKITHWLDRKIQAVKSRRKTLRKTSVLDHMDSVGFSRVPLAPLGKLHFELKKPSYASPESVRFPKNPDRKKLDRPPLMKVPLRFSDIWIRKEFVDDAPYLIALCKKV